MLYRLLQYDFVVEFYSAQKAGKDTVGGKLPEATPKIKIKSESGININMSITDVYSSHNLVLAKQAKIQLWNLPLNFNDEIKAGDIVKIYYKKFADEQKYDFIMAGYLGVPMSTDYENGDFSVDYTIHLVSKSNFSNRTLTLCNFKGMRVVDAIESVFPTRNIINMSEGDKNRVIEESFYATTPKEFLEKIVKKYVQSVYTDIGNINLEVECNYIFSNIDPKNTTTHYEALEDYGLQFIPQQEISIGTAHNYTLSFWNATLTYTHKLKVGTKVSFKDGLSNTVFATIKETSAQLSNTGECSLNLKLYDDSNAVPAVT
ncbi:hypothetical protein DB313_06215 (plasmid) [Borrelia turcica IST7]|uniref:Uncharacterized protein n=1 Tax=Borrelia turcica IST7 TaxID=1104446 RepID=A0A386PNS3_9SPIR|nr:DUF693 family protein [Borrelia turcica]AYE37094.1 hypothetical protein DB313_06215 [Borrelia turcica IST7]